MSKKLDSSKKASKNSRKARPETPAGLMTALDEDRLDGRTRHVKALQETKAALQTNTPAAARAILQHQIAVNLTVQRAILGHVFQDVDNRLVSESGELSDLVGKDLPKLQAQTRAALRDLRELDGKAGQGKTGDEKEQGPNPAWFDVDDGGQEDA